MSCGLLKAISIDANCARHIARHLAIQNVVNFFFLKKISFEWVGGILPRVGILSGIQLCMSLLAICFEAVLVRDCEAAYSADLGTSSKESYWDYNRGWPKWRKVPCCSLVRRGWVSPERMAETVLKWSLPIMLCNQLHNTTNVDLARMGSWLIFQHQYSVSLTETLLQQQM